MSIAGVFQQIATTVMTFKADTSDLKAKIKELTGLEKEAAQATLKSIEARNSGYESLAKKITQVNAVWATANKTLEIGGALLKSYEEDQRLSAATTNISISALRSSSQGLRSDLDLLKLAAAGNAATFKSNNEHLRNAAAAMVAFERAGFESTKATEKVREAILKGNIEPLKELGINLDAAKTKQEQFAQLQTVLAQKAKEAGEAHGGAGEAFKRAAVQYDNAMRDMKVALGELVAGLAPLLSALAKAVGLIADVVGAAGGAVSTFLDAGSLTRQIKIGNLVGAGMPTAGPDFGGRPVYHEAAGMKIGDLGQVFGYYGDEYSAGKAAIKSHDAAGHGSQQALLLQQMIQNDLSGEFDKLVRSGEWSLIMSGVPRHLAPAAAAILKNRKKKKGGGDYNFGGTDLQDSDNASVAIAEYMGARQHDLSMQYSAAAASYGGGDFGGGSYARGQAEYGGGLVGMEGAGDSLSKLAADLQTAGRTSILEQILGPASELSTYQQGLQALGETFNSFGGAVASAYGAWITGAESASAAFKKSLAESMKSLATESVVRALSETAWGFGTLWSNPAESATHFKSAALHAAVAVTAGVAAKGAYSAGWGGGGASGGGGGAPSVIGSGGGGGRAVTDNRPIIVNVGDVFADESPGAKSGRVARAVRMATRETSNVTWDN